MMTNDGNCILREVDVSHPAAKSMIELSRAQDEEVGDGTTSVIILSGEILAMAEPLLQRNFHPTVIVKGYKRRNFKEAYVQFLNKSLAQMKAEGSSLPTATRPAKFKKAGGL